MTVSLSALQENFITLLAYDDKSCGTIRNLVPPELWGGPYREIAARIYEYIDRYKKAPKDHIADLLADKLDNKKHAREASVYEDILLGIKEQYSTINVEYVMGQQLENYVKRQSLRSIAIDLAKALQRDTEESLLEAEDLIASASHNTASVFDPGLRLGDIKHALDFLDDYVECFPTGVPELDKRGFGPTRKELWLYIAAAKRGKTWALIQLAKMAAIHRLKVCHISLEMSRNRSAQRYMQAFFAISKRKETKIVTKFNRDQLGRMVDFNEKEISPKLTLDDPNIRSKLTKRVKKFGPRLLDNIIVKDFPSGQLSVRQLDAYLDSLENNERFTPDLLIIDYPDLMKIDITNYRLGIDEIYKELRGMGTKRNMAVAVVSQSHRAAADAKNVKGKNVAEAYSKIAHADCVITYAQTASEHKMGLARLFVSNGRNDEDQVSIVISQNYAMGTFVVDSCLMTGQYWQNLPQGENDED